MLDIVDKVVKQHLQGLLFNKGNSIPVFAIGTADQDDQVFSQAGTKEKPDRIDLPLANLVRLPNIDITDYNMTKRVHNYTGYDMPDAFNSLLTYYRCTLHYTVTIFAENRKLCEDLATSLYGRLRNYCQLDVVIQLPIKLDDGTYAAATMKCDIELGASIEQTNPLGYDKSQLYKSRITFDLKNVNIYHAIEAKKYTYNIIVQAKLDDEASTTGQEELILEDAMIE